MKWLFFTLVLAGQVRAADFGTFIIVKGNVYVEDIKAVRREAKFNSQILQGETVITEKDSRAKIVMSDRNVINVLPNTRLKIEKYSSAEGDRNVRLNLIEGRIRNRVGPYDTKSSRFEIKTGTSVAGVRGTDFIIGYDAKTKSTDVVVIAGAVSLRSAVASIAETAKEVVIGTQERAQHRGEAEAAKPRKVPKHELEQIKKDSTVANDEKSENSDVISGSDPANPDSDSKSDDSKSDPAGNNSTNTAGGNLPAVPTTGDPVLPSPTTDVNIQITIPGN